MTDKKDEALPWAADMLGELREGYYLTDREIAERTGIDVSTIYRLRTQKTKRPAFDTYSLIHGLWLLAQQEQEGHA